MTTPSSKRLLTRAMSAIRTRAFELAHGGHRETLSNDKDLRIVYRMSAPRAVAWALLFVLALGSVVVRGGYDLRQEYATLMTEFKELDPEGALTLRWDLDVRIQTAHSMLVVAARYLDEMAPPVMSVAQARTRLSQAEGPHALYLASLLLEQSMETLTESLAACALSEQDERYLRQFAATMASTAATMASNPYNNAAEVYNRHFASFPGSIIRFLGMAEKAEFFEFDGRLQLSE